MCYHPFHMYYGCMCKVWQAWDIINTLGSCSPKPQSTQAVGPDLARTVNHLAILGVVYIYIGRWRTACHTCVAMYSTDSWVHVQGLTIMGHNLYTGILSIQASDHPILWYQIRWELQNHHAIHRVVYIGEEPHAMDMLSLIPHVLLVHGQGMTSLGQNQYTVIMFIQVSLPLLSRRWHSNTGPRTPLWEFGCGNSKGIWTCHLGWNENRRGCG